jgi:hypothetical protein
LDRISLLRQIVSHNLLNIYNQLWPSLQDSYNLTTRQIIVRILTDADSGNTATARGDFVIFR